MNKAKTCVHFGCKNPVAFDVKRCPECGGKTPHPDNRLKNGIQSAIALFIAGVFLVILCGIIGESDSSSKQGKTEVVQEETEEQRCRTKWANLNSNGLQRVYTRELSAKMACQTRLREVEREWRAKGWNPGGFEYYDLKSAIKSHSMHIKVLEDMMNKSAKEK